MDLLFTNPVFHGGVNVTIRRGIKWAAISSNEDWETGHPIKHTGQDKIIGFAKIQKKQVFKFYDLIHHDDILQLEHDKNCTWYAGLRDEIKSIYSDFEEDEIVTVLYFTVQMVA
jgi:hypothetical protein